MIKDSALCLVGGLEGQLSKAGIGNGSNWFNAIVIKYHSIVQAKLFFLQGSQLVTFSLPFNSQYFSTG